MSKPKLLDLFCGAGGAAAGYAAAGFEVVGVDIVAQRHYPCTFIQADALTFLQEADLSVYDAAHASPVCKAYTECNLSPRQKHPRQIDAVRDLLQRTGKPWVIENVYGARSAMQASLLLCGSMFNLPVQRHRLFESNVFLFAPAACDHRNTTIAVYGHSVWDSSKPGTRRRDGRGRPDSVPLEVGRAAMGIEWMSRNELAQAIPPAYTRWIGLQLMRALPPDGVISLEETQSGSPAGSMGWG